jgi:DNA polymerase III sliding clamp (beta) subunit (PCNA family)
MLSLEKIVGKPSLYMIDKDQNIAIFEYANGLRLISKLVVGRYPDWRRVAAYEPEYIAEIEANDQQYSDKARIRAEYIEDRQFIEMQRFAEFIANIKKPEDKKRRQRALSVWMR